MTQSQSDSETCDLVKMEARLVRLEKRHAELIEALTDLPGGQTGDFCIDDFRIELFRDDANG